MALIINIESTAQYCSVALSRSGQVISLRESKDDRSHAYRLAPFIDEVLKESNVYPSKLDAIAVSKGPGSYTGLRIGVSTAKGMAYALNIPLIGINTLYSMVRGLLTEHPEYAKNDIVLCPMIDARRMEVYTCLYNSFSEPLRDITAEIINNESFKGILEQNTVVFFGDGALKCRKLISHRNAVFVDDFFPSATYLAIPSFDAYQQKKFENTAYFEPFYLKDFVATIPKNKMP